MLGFVSAANMSLSVAFYTGCVVYGAGENEMLVRDSLVCAGACVAEAAGAAGVMDTCILLKMSTY